MDTPSHIKSYANPSLGFTFVELIVVIFIISMVLVPVIISINSIGQAATNVEHSITAAYLAKEGIELARNYRDTDALTYGYDDKNGFGCFGNCPQPPSVPAPTLDDINKVWIASWNANRLISIANKNSPYTKVKRDSSGLYYQTTSVTGDPDTIYSRVIGTTVLVQSGGESPFVEIRVIATVSWQESGTLKNVVSEEHLFNYKFNGGGKGGGD